jgi:hypothetical protein
MHSGIFDGKRWDWGQWVCVLLYGKDWMHHPEFLKINALNLKYDDEYIPPIKTAQKLLKLEEWLLELIKQKQAKKSSQTGESNGK